jgi:DNA-binding MarR family transcriptional regulator
MNLSRYPRSMSAQRSEQSPADGPGSTTGRDEAAQTFDLVRRLVDVAEAIRTVVDDVLTEYAVSPSAAGMLWTLQPHTTTQTMRDIARQLGCDPSTVSLTADKLEQAGLVVRGTHPHDGRKRTLSLTDDGLRLREAISNRLHESRLLAWLPEERVQLATLLDDALTRATPGR